MDNNYIKRKALKLYNNEYTSTDILSYGEIENTLNELAGEKDIILFITTVIEENRKSYDKSINEGNR